MTSKDKAYYGCSPPCMMKLTMCCFCRMYGIYSQKTAVYSNYIWQIEQRADFWERLLVWWHSQRAVAYWHKFSKVGSVDILCNKMTTTLTFVSCRQWDNSRHVLPHVWHKFWKVSSVDILYSKLGSELTIVKKIAVCRPSTCCCMSGTNS